MIMLHLLNRLRGLVLEKRARWSRRYAISCVERWLKHVADLDDCRQVRPDKSHVGEHHDSANTLDSCVGAGTLDFLPDSGDTRSADFELLTRAIITLARSHGLDTSALKRAADNGTDSNTLDAAITEVRLLELRLRMERCQLLGTAQQRAETGDGAATPKTLTDGPVPPTRFDFDGESVRLEPRPWNLLTYVWHSPNQTCRARDAIATVWSGEFGPLPGANDNSVKTAIKKINTALRQVRFPKSFSHKNTHFIIS